VVAAEEETKPSPDNLIPLSINADGSPFIGANGEDGYKVGWRMSSKDSGGVEKQITDEYSSKVAVTGYMPIKSGDTIHLTNISMHRTDSSAPNKYSYISIFKNDFSVLESALVPNINTTNHGYLFGEALLEMDSDGYVTSFTLVDAYNNLKDGGYLRISAPNITNKSAITVDEEID
jgi:hypothetical protein